MNTPTTLYEFYTEWIGINLPSIDERAELFENYGLGSADSYTGTAEQNIVLLDVLLQITSPPPPSLYDLAKDIDLTAGQGIAGFTPEGLAQDFPTWTTVQINDAMNWLSAFDPSASYYEWLIEWHQYLGIFVKTDNGALFDVPPDIQWAPDNINPGSFISPDYIFNPITNELSIKDLLPSDLPDIPVDDLKFYTGVGFDGVKEELTNIITENFIKPNVHPGILNLAAQIKTAVSLKELMSGWLLDVTDQITKGMDAVSTGADWDDSAAYSRTGQFRTDLNSFFLENLGGGGSIISNAIDKTRIVLEYRNSESGSPREANPLEFAAAIAGGSSGVDANKVEITFVVQDSDSITSYIAEGDGGMAAFCAANGDIVTGSVYSDLLIGRDGSDSLSGMDGDDHLSGFDGTDILRGGYGDDTLTGGGYNDHLYGDEGNDSIIGGTDNDYISGGDGNDVILSDDHDDCVFGGTGNDSIVGANGNDLIFGDDGNDTLRGGTGNDDIWGDADDDSIQGGAGNDYILGGDDDDVLRGGTGKDTLHGNFGDDTLHGGEAGDSLLGDEGNDYLSGRLGNDTLIGGSGSDKFVFFSSIATGDIDTIIDFVHGQDEIWLNPAIFTSLAPYAGAHIGLGINLLYNSGTGLLSYDADGAGAGAAVAFANVGTGLSFGATDFFIGA